MGTRNLTVVIKDGNVRVAQYCQWDGYPSGQGVEILSFLRDKYDPVMFEANLAKTRPMTPEDVEKLWEAEGAVNGMASLEVSDSFEKKYPTLHRNMGGTILEYIQNNAGVPLEFTYDFGYNSLFCEWAYVVDLDRRMLEVYGGFQKNPLPKTERWYKEDMSAENEHREPHEWYYGVAKLIEYPFIDLPSDEDFVKEVEYISHWKERYQEFGEVIKSFEKHVETVDSWDKSMYESVVNYLKANADDIFDSIYIPQEDE